MTKKRRLGSDPLSWIGDSRPTKPNQNDDTVSVPEETQPNNTEEVIQQQVEKVDFPERQIEEPITHVDSETAQPEETQEKQRETSPEELNEIHPEVKTEPEAEVFAESKSEVELETENEHKPEIQSSQEEEMKPETNPKPFIDLEGEDEPATPMQTMPPNAEPKKTAPPPSPVAANTENKQPNFLSEEAATEIKENIREKQEGKFLTFYLADEEYAIEILKVQEIIGILPITPVPNTISYIRGVINLRGQVIPVMELRVKFGMEIVEYTDQSCIIVVQSLGNRIGIIVDQVSEVTQLKADDIDTTPSFGNTIIDTEYILGIGKSGGEIKLLLDIDKVLKVTHY